MDGIRRLGVDPNISATDFSGSESVNSNVSTQGGISSISDEVESGERNGAIAPGWTNGNESDPGVTLPQVPSFLSESLLYRADQITQKSPHVAFLASTAAEPFYQNTIESMKGSDAANDVSLIRDQLTKMSDQTTNYANLGSMPDGDIAALCFLVLMQASKSAQEDLKSIMAGVKAINNAKAQQRQNLSAAQQEQAGLTGQSDPSGQANAGGETDVLKRFLTSSRDALSTLETDWWHHHDPD